MTHKAKNLLLSLLVLCATFCAAQTAVLLPEPKIQFLGATGVPLSGGCVQTYAAGTTTPQASFTDSTGGVSNTNPVILDSAGRASIFLSQGIQYKFVVTSFGGSNCATGTLQYTQDNVALGSTLTVGGANTQVQYNSAGALAGSANFTWNNATQTLTIGALVTTSGGTLGGTFAGSPTFSGNPVFTGAPTFSGGGTFYGTWAGGPSSSVAIAPGGASESGTTVTITTVAVCSFVANQLVNISGIGVAGYNGTWMVVSGCSGGSSFTYSNTASALGTSGSGTVTGSPLFSNGLSVTGGSGFSGTGYHSGTENFSGPVNHTALVTQTHAGVFTNTQTSEYLQSLIGGCTTAEYNTVQAGNFATDAVAGCVTMPVTATVHQVDGISGYVVNNVNVSQSGGAVGGYFQARNTASNASSFGSNSLVQDTLGNTAHQMISTEIDINILGTPARAWGILVSGASNGTVPALGSAAGVEVRSPGYGLSNSLHWPASFNSIDSAAVIALNVGTTATGNSVGSQTVVFNSRDAGGVARTASISTSLNGLLNVSAPLQATGTAAALTGTGACATFSTQTGGSWAGRATCTAGTAASTFVITPGTTATNGFVCVAFDQTTRTNLLQQTATTTTACTLTATSVTQNDVIVFTATAF